jgi:hypothetical protein
MNTKNHRRNFLKNLTATCAGGCLLTTSVFANTSGFTFLWDEDEKLNPKELNYCGYKCPDNCQFLKGTLNNDEALKKEAYKLWKIEERFGVPFEADKIFCYGCKNHEKPTGIVLKNCTVRSCAMEKEHDSCIECDELVACEKDLWDRFPKFKEQVIEMQKKYQSQV